MTVSIVVSDSVTSLPREAHGAVLVTGSHGGLIAAHYAFAAGVRAAIFNDAGRGLDDAGVAGVHALDGAGLAAAAVAHTSARIAVASDTLARGMVSSVNVTAAALGVAPGMTCRDAAERMRNAPVPTGRLVAQRESRFVIAKASAEATAILGLDSIGGVLPADAGTVLVIGSHGGLHGGDPASALAVAAAGVLFHDAGGGRDDAGFARLPALQARGMPAATVDYRSARIGDARSMWATGVLSRVNAAAATMGVRTGMRVDDAAIAFARSGTGIAGQASA